MTEEALPVPVPVLEVKDLVRHYRLPRESLFAEPGHVYALNGVSFEIQKGKSFGIVGKAGAENQRSLATSWHWRIRIPGPSKYWARKLLA